MDIKIFYLYKIVNSVNEKVYIGITCRPERRLRQHFSKRSNSTKLKHAIAKYGQDSFKMEILCIGEEDYILDLEVKMILAYDSIMAGYNLVLGNPKTGGASLSEETKKSISRGLNAYHQNNVAWNKGVVLGFRKPYDPCFVTGFWFPHPTVALSSLGINQKTFYNWGKQGTLGEVQHLRNNNTKDHPTYVSGFWFNTLVQASISLNQKLSTLNARIRKGNLEQKNNKTFKYGEENHAYGKKGFESVRGKPVIVNGVLYGSISQASENTEFTKHMIYTRLKNNTPGFSRP